MKKLLLVFAVLSIGLSASAQKLAAASQESLKASRTSGTYQLQLPGQVTSDDVNGVKGYYTDYFVVNYNEQSHQATFTLTKKEDMNRRVIMRFLKSVGAEGVRVNATNYTIEEFYDTFLK